MLVTMMVPLTGLAIQSKVEPICRRVMTEDDEQPSDDLSTSVITVT